MRLLQLARALRPFRSALVNRGGAFDPDASDSIYLHDFVAQSTLGEYTPLATWDVTGAGYAREGEAYFVLRLQQ